MRRGRWPIAVVDCVVGSVRGGGGELRLLKGLDFPGAWEESRVRREVKVRGESVLVVPEEEEGLEVARDSLLDL